MSKVVAGKVTCFRALLVYAIIGAALAIPPYFYFIPKAEAQSPGVCDDCAAKRKALAFEEDHLKFLRGQLDNLQSRVKAINDAIRDRRPPKATDDEAAALANWNRTLKELNKAIDDANATIQTLKAELAKCGTVCPPAGTKPQTSGTTPVIAPQQVPATTPPSGAGKSAGPGATPPPVVTPGTTKQPATKPTPSSGVQPTEDITGLVLSGPVSPVPSNCPECAAAANAVAIDQQELQRLNSEYMAERIDDKAKEIEGKIYARKRVLEDDQAKLDACIFSCALRELPPLPPEIPIGRHPAPVACPACGEAVERADAAFLDVLTAEYRYIQQRASAFSLRTWLSGHANERGSAVYVGTLMSYVGSLKALSETRQELTAWLQKYDRAMRDLEECKALRCGDSSAVTPGMLSPVPAEESPEAECPQCEGAALKLKADLALLRAGRALREYFRPGDKYSAQLNEKLAQAEEDARVDREALAACNKQFPKAACEPPPPKPAVPGPDKTLRGPQPPEVKPLGSTGMLPGRQGPSIAMANIGMIMPQFEYDLSYANSFLPRCRVPKIFFLGDRYTFGVDEAGLNAIRASWPFAPHAFRLPDGTYVVSVSAEEMKTYQITIKNGQPALDPCRRMQPESGPAVAAGSCAPGTDGLPVGAVHVSGSFGATLVGSDGQPVPGAYVIYGPPSPTPFFNPGERPGDEQPPTIVRTGSDGSYKAPLAGLSGPIEISVAKGCDTYSTSAIVDGPSAPPQPRDAKP